MIYKMKQAVVISILIVSFVSFAYTEENEQIQETERSLGGTTLLDGGRNYRRNTQYGPSYQKEVSNRLLNNRVHQSIVNYHHPLASSSITTPTRRRERRAAPDALRYNRDGTISLRCRYSPASCRTVNRRRSRRGGKRLFSLYLKPPAEEGSSFDNLFKKFAKPGGRGAPSRVRTQKQSQGKRIFSIRLKTADDTRRPVQNGPSNIYTRAFQRFTDDIARKENRRISKPRVTKTKGTPSFYKINKRIAKPRGRRAPPRPRSQKRKPGTGKGKEIFSLFLKPPAAEVPNAGLRNPYHRPRGKHAPPRADIPLICRFQPAKCGRKGQKLFSIYYKGFKNVFPKSFL